MYDVPEHFPMGVTADGRGPTDPDPPHHYACWCGQQCVWMRAFADVWRITRINANLTPRDDFNPYVPGNIT
jgi:hypothetical protein